MVKINQLDFPLLPKDPYISYLLEKLKAAPTRKLKKREYLIQSDEAFEHIYIVLSGSFKSSLFTPDGRDQIIAFSMPGDLLGVDGIYQNRHLWNVSALENSEVLVIPYLEFQLLAAKDLELQSSFNRILSHEIIKKNQIQMYLNTMTAEEKLATFTLNMSYKYHLRGLPSQEFQLKMSRSDIANYLGLKLETVSRTLKKLKISKILEIELKRVKICNLDKLIELAPLSNFVLATSQ